MALKEKQFTKLKKLNTRKMKKLVMLAAALIAAAAAFGQGYELTFKTKVTTDTMQYLAQHFRDKFIFVDSCRVNNGTATFKGRRNLETGVYCLLNSEKKKILDVMIDDSRKFAVNYEMPFSNATTVVTGSKANQSMFDYMARQDAAHKQAKDIEEEKKNAKTDAEKDAIQKKMDKLSEEMIAFQNNYFEQTKKYKFTQLISKFDNIDVPQDLSREDQVVYFRRHYWDKLDLSDHSLIYTPQLFDKVNFYFFGVLYYQPIDSLTYYGDLFLHKIENDSTMMRYVMEFITPRYERSTKKVGWDQMFVHLVEQYYLKGKCPWATEGELYNKRGTVDFLKSSLIGAPGPELFMADTNQSTNSADWISSHRFPQKYVMLWFWDPDCHHCQEQTAELKILYDSLTRVGNKIFEVYAVGFEADVPKWKKYVREHELPFVNVGGINVNIDYQAAYNVHGAPTMILLNADRKIIMNKNIPTDSVLPFIEQYEKEHPEEANRQPSKWMLEGQRLYGKK